MRFDPINQRLLTDDGRLIKKVRCPKNLGLDDLQRQGVSDQSRRCTECKSTIVNIAKFSDDEALALLQNNPSTCVFALPGAIDFVLPTPGASMTEAHEFEFHFGKILRHYAADTTIDAGAREFDFKAKRKIQTARGVDAINQAVAAGFWPLLRILEDAPNIQRSNCYRQHRQTGKIEVLHDGRQYFQDNEAFSRTDWVSFSPIDTSKIVAAYLLPQDLALNEEVELLDIISHIVGGEKPMGKVRLERAHAIWRGDHFEILVPEPYLVLG